MSHFKERKEKICLNCNAELQGRFCHKCGPENIEPKESFLHLLSHLVSHEFHFDSKFFSTAKHLLLTLGFLTKEYMAGRRVSYLDPIRMYIFLSAFFFLVVFSLNKGETNLVNATYKNPSAKKQALAAIKEVKDEINDSLSDGDDSLSQSQRETLKQRALILDKYENYISKDSTNADSILHY
jgi:ribosomal protein L40E